MWTNPETGKPEKKFFLELKYDTFVGEPKEDVIEDFNKRTYLDDAGVVRWVKSDNVPPADWLEDFKDLGLITEDAKEKSLVAKDIDTTRAVTDYIESRKRWKEEDPVGYDEAQREMAFEARAAYGPGEECVNVITGETFTT
tara:strand:- start:16 stop:438 length:423 start_codon:yes stop_codon:yes gene_type:complete